MNFQTSSVCSVRVTFLQAASSDKPASGPGTSLGENWPRTEAAAADQKRAPRTSPAWCTHFQGIFTQVCIQHTPWKHQIPKHQRLMNIKYPKYFLVWLELASFAELEQGAHLVQQEKATLSCFPFHFIEERLIDSGKTEKKWKITKSFFCIYKNHSHFRALK